VQRAKVALNGHWQPLNHGHQLDRDDDPSCYNGPPYAVAELVFDEYDIEDCTREPDPDDATSPAVSAGPAGGSP
jgi:hypothetical protein